MPRNMSFSMTTEQIKDRSKTVTRRMGWRHLEPGHQVWAVEKAMGLKKGEKVKRLALLKVVDVRRERLELMTTAEEFPPGKYYGDRECVLEGFPEMSSAGFVDMFVAANRCAPSDDVTRIEFEYVRLPMIEYENR